MSIPESTTVTGFPGPGGFDESAPTAARHHCIGTSGSPDSTWAVIRSRPSGRLNPITPARRRVGSAAVGTRQIRSSRASSIPPALRARAAPLAACPRSNCTSSACARPTTERNSVTRIRSLTAKALQSTPPTRVRGVARAFVGLGSNLGDRESTLRAAVGRLRGLVGTEVRGVSRFRDTEPVGYLDQPRFLNGAVELETALSPQALLAALLELERAFGRDRAASPPQGPRTLDLDLLLYGEDTIAEPGLEVPHPRLHERRFVLEPLAELDPALVVPAHGPIQVLLAKLDS